MTRTITLLVALLVAGCTVATVYPDGTFHYANVGFEKRIAALAATRTATTQSLRLEGVDNRAEILLKILEKLP